MKRKNHWIVIAICCVVISVIISFIFVDYSLKIRAAGILLAGLIMWISEALPISISTLFLLTLLPILDLMDYGTVIKKFGTETSLFIMASSGITVALVSSSIPKQIINSVFSKFGKHPIVLVYLFGLVISLFSAFVSSLATCALFTMLISAVLDKSVVNARKTNLGEALMLVIPACSGIGGFMSPAGTPANLLVINLLKENGFIITFVNWCAIGFPIGIVAALIFISSVVIHFRPETIVEYNFEQSIERSKSDYIVISVLTITIIGWILSSFITSLNITTVALLSLFVLFIPKLGILNIKSFQEGVNWDLVIAMGSVSVFMNAISDTGIIQDGVNAVLGNVYATPKWMTLIVVSICICFFRSFIPTTTAVIALFTPIVISISSISQINIVTLMFVLAFWAASALLLVFTEPIYLIAYKEGYFEAIDLAKAGFPSCLILSLVVGCVIDFLVGIIS